MGLLRGSPTFSRFRVAGERPKDIAAFIDRQIRQYAFQDIAAEGREKILGWTDIENILDTDFRNASYALGDFLLFSLRIDRRTIPPSLLKIRALEAESRYLKETGRKTVDKIARDEIRESISRDLLRRMPPTPAFYDVCWSVSSGSLLFTCLTEKVMQDFQDLFKATFNLTPMPYVPWGRQQAHDETMPGDPLLRTADPGGVDLKTIGREFLTWLWFKSEERDGMIALPDGAEVEVHFVRRLVLESGDGEYSESVVCQGMHTDLREGREALRRGKKIREARLQLSRDAARWEFTFKADLFQFQSLKLPVVMDTDDGRENRDSRVLERIYLVETVVRSMDQLFDLFFVRHRSDLWQEERQRMEKWLQV
jgi:recombination associated protein RdgC